jgi:hypothetical protein
MSGDYVIVLPINLELMELNQLLPIHELKIS